MNWIITVDHIGTKAVNTSKQGKLAPEQATIYAEPLATQFRLLDGDNEIYFEGVCGDLNTDEENAFDPLDSFGVAYGCVTLMYDEGNGWEEL